MARWGKADFRQLKKLQKRLEKLEKADLDYFSEQMVKQLAARMLAKVIKRTPVGQYPAGSGKVGGTLRRGWTSQSQREAELNTVFGGSSGMKSYLDSITVAKKGDIYEIEIINPVEYASYVEYGHRTANHAGWVPGRFMMTISEQELERDAPKIIEKALEKKLREVFGNGG